MRTSETLKIIVVMVVMISIVAIADATLSTSNIDLSSIIVRNKSMYTVTDAGYNYVNQRPDPAEPGGTVEVRLKVENIGSTDAPNVLFELLPEFPFSLEGGQTARVRLGRIGARQVGEDAYIVYYKLKVDENAVEGVNMLKFKYSKDNGKSWVLLDTFYVRVQAHNAILGVEKVEATTSSPGNTARINITLKNTADSMLKDIKIKLNVDEAAFVPAGSTNEKMISRIEPGKEVIVSFSLIAQVNAASKAHRVPLEIVYYDELGRNYSQVSSIGVIINEKPQYIVNIDETGIYTTNNKGKVVISISNIGSSEIKYLATELMPSSDYAILSTPKVYLGNLDSDDFDSAEYEIFMKANARKVPLLLKISYKDSFNSELADNVVVEMPLYTSREASAYGIGASSGIASKLITIVIFVVLTVPWLFMVAECVKTPMVRYKKILWMAMVVGGYVVGAAIFYFYKKKKSMK